MLLDDAYANADHIPGGSYYPARWDKAAQAVRDRVRLAEYDVPYGPGPRQFYDLFHPGRLSKGTLIFVHGGYWKAFGPRDFSHLAAAAVDAGYAVAMPGYTLAPEARIGQITDEIAQAIAAIAQHTTGPLWLAGHSAGGHLVARMACAERAADWTGRVQRIMPISPLSDLAPLMQTSMNADLRIDAAEAEAESPLKHDRLEVPVTVWVGGAERPAFLDQARWLGEAWGCEMVVEPEKHHFDVIEGLEDMRSPMMRALFA